MQQVGEASADASVRVGQSVDEGAGVRRTVQRPLVQVQQGQIATVASQRVKNTGRGAGGGSGPKEDATEELAGFHLF